MKTPPMSPSAVTALARATDLLSDIRARAIARHSRSSAVLAHLPEHRRRAATAAAVRDEIEAGAPPREVRHALARLLVSGLGGGGTDQVAHIARLIGLPDAGARSRQFYGAAIVLGAWTRLLSAHRSIPGDRAIWSALREERAAALALLRSLEMEVAA